ncbi:superinfection immunity protein [Halotalea alkalilenta]|uniref:superinfection immunity protein n=1 Tax=Halotalea alkalilenta TaxID=376489 RepID=UPI0005B86830|nr:superinfection immunity protein [Halotalea alkalilenta]
MEVVFMVGSLVFYFVPALIAMARKHASQNAIFLLNLFGGWTLLGWFAALVWACTHPIPGRGAVSAALPEKSRADQLEKLAGLREKGVLTEDEFQSEKHRLLSDQSGTTVEGHRRQ